MTTDDAPRWVVLARGPNARLLYTERSRRYRWQCYDEQHVTLVWREIEVFEAAVLHTLLPTKVREMP